MTQQQWKDLVYNQIDIDTVDGQMMKCLAQIPDLMQRARHALKSPLQPALTLLGIQEEVRALRDSLLPNLKSLRERWMDTDSSLVMQYPGFVQHRAIIHAHYSRSYGLALALAIILNCMLAALDCNTPEISEGSAQLSDEVIILADVVDQYRPLGTTYMILSLAAAWVGATDPAKKAIIETRLTDYQNDVQGPSGPDSSAGLELIDKRFNLK